MKDKYSRFRELWAVPKYKILFKLGGWFCFFVLFFIVYAIGSTNPEDSKNISQGLSYNKMKTNIMNSNLSIKYHLSSQKEYIIEGTLINNIINGTIETDELNRIKITGEDVYLLKKDEEEKSPLLNEFNLIYLYPSNIMDIINNNPSVMRQSDNNKIYSYTIDNKAYSVYINDKEIYKIVLLDGTNTYELEYQIID